MKDCYLCIFGKIKNKYQFYIKQIKKQETSSKISLTVLKVIL